MTPGLGEGGYAGAIEYDRVLLFGIGPVTYVRNNLKQPLLILLNLLLFSAILSFMVSKMLKHF